MKLRTLVALFIFSLICLHGCGGKSGKAPAQNNVENDKDKPNPPSVTDNCEVAGGPKGDAESAHQELTPSTAVVVEDRVKGEVQGALNDLMLVPEGIAREIKGINYGTESCPIWGKKEWVHYFKPWRRNSENIYARVKLNLPKEASSQQSGNFLVWCHFHGEGKLFCHKSSATSQDELGQEPLDEDYPADQPVGECDPIENENCDPF